MVTDQVHRATAHAHGEVSPVVGQVAYEADVGRGYHRDTVIEIHEHVVVEVLINGLSGPCRGVRSRSNGMRFVRLIQQCPLQRSVLDDPIAAIPGVV